MCEGSMYTVKFTRERMIYYPNSTMDSVRKLRESNTATQNDEQVHTNNSTFESMSAAVNSGVEVDAPQEPMA